MLRRKRRLHKWMAIMLAVLLLAGQSDAFVQAEEGVGDVPQTEISSEKVGTDTQDQDNTTGGSNTENADNTGDDNTENADSTGGNTENPDNTGDGSEGNNGGTDDGNTGDDTETVPGTDGGNTGDSTEGGDGQDQCTCETACTAEAVNTECSVCMADYSVCAKNAGGGVNPAEEVEILEAEPVMLADEGVEVSRAREFEVNNVKYIIWGEASVTVQDKDQVSGEITILNQVHDGTMSHPVTQIGEGAFAGCSGLQKITIPEGIEVIGANAFSGCSGLTEIEIPNSVTEIWSNAFEGCTNLQSVKLPDGLTRINKQVFKSCGKLWDIEIPASVKNIYQEAFFGCTSLGTILDSKGNITGLQEIKIPNSVTAIYDGAFWDCTGLTSITLPDNIQQIFPFVFSGCSNLSDVKIPDGVGQGIGAYAFSNCDSLVKIKIPEKVTKIHHDAFSGCDSLQTVELQNGITIIEQCAFQECGSLKSIKLPKSVTSIEGGGFYNCTVLNKLYIVVSSDGEINPITVGAPVATGEGPLGTFANLPSDRTIVFLAEDGSELTGEPLKNAINAYIEAGKTDGEPDDGKWYGWSVGELSETVDTYKVTISVQKDGQPWTVDCDRKFALSKDNGNTFVENLDAVEAGDYVIYDVTDGENKLNTDISVKVTNAGVVSDAVNYYTVTFYDGDVAYSEDTPQKPQIVLSGRQAARPADPGKANCQFAGWKTTDGGSTVYDFGSDVKGTTGIYASWIEKAAEQLHIMASVEEGGTISPTGDIPVTRGGEQTFTITPNEGNRIKAVKVDDNDVTAELAGTLARAQAGARYYTFTNVTENHTIHATFERDGNNPGGGGDNPNPGGGDNSNPGGGGNSNTDGGSTENVQVTVVSETVSQQAENSAAADTGTPQPSNGQGNAAPATGQTAGGNGTASDGKEPKTGDTSYLEVYATLAMIAGLTWLLLCFMDEARGMSEHEKEVFVAAFIRWGKKGGAFRKCCAMAAIFCLLAYYHIVGKRVGKNALPENCLRQAS